MALTLVNLDRRVRDLMLTEFDLDRRKNDLYLPARLNQAGREAFPPLLREAIDERDDDWLAARLREGSYFNRKERRRTARGATTWAEIPKNAAEVLAEGEINRFYLRALCLRAIGDGLPHLVVYRAKEVSRPRAASEAKIGALIDPRKLLEDLRTHQGVDTSIGIPAGPSSGLSARLP